MPKSSGIIGVDHVAIATARIEEAEKHYAELFGAVVLWRSTIVRGEWATIDGDPGWDEIHRHRIKVDSAFLRAGALTIALIDEPAGKAGPVNHVGVGCSDPEARRIKETAKRLGLRFLEDSLEGFKIIDAIGVTWEISRGTDVKGPAKRLDLGSGRIV